jgi:O-antigen ligase
MLFIATLVALWSNNNWRHREGKLRIPISVSRAMVSDARPRLWAFYVSQLPTNPWFGVGFGKPVPSLACGTLIPDDLVELDGNVRTHAHNVFLNTLVQIGVTGPLIQLSLFAFLAYQSARALR